MAKESSSLLKQYDRLAAVLVLAILLISLCYLVFAGLGQQKKVRTYDGSLENRKPSNAQIDAANLSDAEKEFKKVQNPGTAKLLLNVKSDPDAPNLCTPERRLLCVGCAQPISWSAKVCLTCKAKQPEENKIDLSTVDSDGDGMFDPWEIENGLNHTNEKDADLDNDNDGFTNLEEFEAKSNPRDPKSHPGYETRMKLEGIVGDKLPLRVIDVMELPSSKDEKGTMERHYLLTFVSVDADGKSGQKPLRVKTGAMVGNSGFRVVRYHDLPLKQIKVGKHEQVRFVKVSTIDLERVADRKKATLTFFDAKNPDWQGEPLLEQKATIAIDLPEVKPVTVAAGAGFTVKGEKYTVLSVNAEKKKVLIEKVSDKKSFELK
ncbi:MAG: Amuc_1099 family pilus-like system protein [Kiritimatiellia bacterium]